VRLLAVPWLIGIWFAAAALGGPVVVTALLTIGAAALGAWALAALRSP
jgi:hypothetical protein